jgi:NodT family efflux transporter outer membrane factor (OMF) lipoprotein
MTRFVLPLMLSVALAGCAVGPDYRKPDLALTPSFHTPAPETQPAARAARLDAWWAAFGDPELTRIVERAAAQNLDLVQAQARLAQSRAAARAAGAALLPIAEATGSAAKVTQSLDGPIGTIGRHLPGFERDVDDDALGFGASWEVDLFGGLRRQREAARAGVAASQADAAAVKLAVEADAADAYLQIRADQARIAVARRQQQVQQDLVALLNKRLSEGVSPERDLRQAEAARAGVDATIPPLTIALEAELNRLDVLMGAQPGTYRAELINDAAIPAAPAFAETATPADLLRRRPDVVAAEARLRAANARIGAAVAEYYPHVSLAALLGVDSLKSGTLFDGDARQSQLAVGLRWRLFDFGRIDAEVAAARGRDAEAMAAYRLSVLKAAEEVENAFTRLTQERSRAIALERQIAALAVARRQAEEAYEGGVISLVEVRDADSGLLAASDQLVQARAGAARAAVASVRAFGGGCLRVQQ